MIRTIAGNKMDNPNGEGTIKPVMIKKKILAEFNIEMPPEWKGTEKEQGVINSFIIDYIALNRFVYQVVSCREYPIDTTFEITEKEIID